MLSRSIKEAENSKTSKIYTINADDYLMYYVAKSCFKLRDDEVYNSILADFELLQKRLSLKSIPYEKLKGALVTSPVIMLPLSWSCLKIADADIRG